MEKRFFIFTISEIDQVINMFQKKEDTWCYPDTYFLGSEFRSKEDALNFASEVERLKFENGETKFTIKATHDKGYFPCLCFK